MTERGFNYPNHPLFRIAPLLDKGFQTVRFDPYESILVAKIRAGQYSADLWDCNGFYLDYSDRLASPADRQLTAFKSRHKMTPEQLKEYREKLRAAWEANAPERARREEERATAEAARRQEHERVQREWAERRAEKERREAEREAEWERADAERKAAQAQRQAEIEARHDEERARVLAERAAQQAVRAAELIELDRLQSQAQRRLKERAKILAAPWQCKKCLKRAKVVLRLGKYELVCRPCDVTVQAEHERLLKVLEAA